MKGSHKMKTGILLFTLLITTAIFSASKAAELETPAVTDAETKQTELTAFGNQICDATLKGLKETLKILNLEFGIRLQMDDKQLKESGLTIDEAIKQNEAMINTLADTGGQDETKPDKCKITKISGAACDDIFKQIAAEGAFGVKVEPAKVAEAAKAMNIGNCGVISIVASVKDIDQPVDFAAAKTNEKWSIIVGFAPAPADQSGETAESDKQPETTAPKTNQP